MEINSKFRAEMEADIQKCEEYPSKNGSGDIYRGMCAKYSTIDPDFQKSVTFGGKAFVPGGDEPDYRKELKAIASRLKGLLLTVPTVPQDKRNEEFERLVADIPTVQAAFHECMGVKVVYNSAEFADWRERAKYLLRDMWQDETVKEMLNDLDRFNGFSDVEMFNSVSCKCRIIYENITRYFRSSEGNPCANVAGNKVFIVHGHDTETKITVARTLEQLGLEAVILHEQADEGKTIIEKLETYTADVAYAIILYTGCDVGRAKEDTEANNNFRARQNVVFEHGLFIGSLGRKRVCALVKGKVEKPGDIDGVVYVDMDDAGAWKMQLCKNMKAVGIDVDMNRL